MIAAVTIAVIAVLLAVFSKRIINAVGDIKAAEYTASDLNNVDNIVLLTHCAEVDGRKNSVAGVKEAVRLGADAVAVDLCFRQDGTPVITDDYSEVGSAPLLEDLFRAMTDKKYSDVKVFLNIVQLSDMSELNRLAVDFDLVSRLFIVGIDTDHYGLITGDDTIIPFYLDYKFKSEELKEIEKGTFAIPEVLSQYGATGFVIEASDSSVAVIGALDDYGIPCIVKEIKNNSQLAEALIDNAQTVWVDDIEGSSVFLDGWISEMQERYESLVEASLNALSTASVQK